VIFKVIVKKIPVAVSFYEKMKWKPIKISGGDKTGLICLVTDSSDIGYTCYLTDLVNLYLETLDKSAFIAKFTQLNSDLEVDDFTEIQTDLLKQLQGDNRDTKIKTSDASDGYSIDMSWEDDGIPYNWSFQMSKGSAEQFHQIVTTQLYHCVVTLNHQKEILLGVIRDKDLEIEDYENGGAKLSRKSLKTSRFQVSVDLDDKVATKSLPSANDLLSSSKYEELLKISKNLFDAQNKSSENAKNDPSNENKHSVKRKVEKPNLAKIARGPMNKKQKFNL